MEQIPVTAVSFCSCYVENRNNIWLVNATIKRACHCRERCGRFIAAGESYKRKKKDTNWFRGKSVQKLVPCAARYVQLQQLHRSTGRCRAALKPDSYVCFPREHGRFACNQLYCFPGNHDTAEAAQNFENRTDSDLLRYQVLNAKFPSPLRISHENGTLRWSPNLYVFV